MSARARMALRGRWPDRQAGFHASCAFSNRPFTIRPRGPALVPEVKEGAVGESEKHVGTIGLVYRTSTGTARTSRTIRRHLRLKHLRTASTTHERNSVNHKPRKLGIS